LEHAGSRIGVTESLGKSLVGPATLELSEMARHVFLRYAKHNVE
jgi:hypothetical protein